MIMRKKPRNAKIGIFAVSHSTYDGQFPGLYDNLNRYHGDLVSMIEKNDVEVVDFGMIDTSEKAFEALPKMQGAGLDLLICNMVTYATSSVFAPIIRDVKAPVILIVLQPRSKLDYSKASTFMQLENDNICSVPEFIGVAHRLDRKVYDVIIGKLYDDKKAEREIAEWCDIAKVLHDLKGARMGLMGHTDRKSVV